MITPAKPLSEENAVPPVYEDQLNETHKLSSIVNLGQPTYYRGERKEKVKSLCHKFCN